MIAPRRMRPIRVFISSVQSEFATERARLCEYIRRDPMLGVYFSPFIFENVPAMDASVQEVYLKEARESDVFIGLMGAQYGYEDEEGISPSEREYDMATKHQRHRLIFIKKSRKKRHPKEMRFIEKIEKEVIREVFDDYDSLQHSVYVALVLYMQHRDLLRKRPFDASYHEAATLEDIDRSAVVSFIRNAQSRRLLHLSERADTRKVLTHLNLMSEQGALTNAALLLFAKEPQRFLPASEVKCAQFFGTEIEKPIPFYQVYQGNVFELIDQAVAFVMTHIDATVGTREKRNSVDVDYELPLFAVREAIVNAVTHRDYSCSGSVQVMLFRDRLEVWNPGRLPDELSIERLSKPHQSIPFNTILAQPIFMAGYIERLGTGTGDIIRSCTKKGLLTPLFEQEDSFRVVIWRKAAKARVTPSPQDAPRPKPALSSLSSRQKAILTKLRKNPTCTTEKLASDMKLQSRTIARDLEHLKSLGFLERMGNTRWGAWAVLISPSDDSEMS